MSSGGMRIGSRLAGDSRGSVGAIERGSAAFFRARLGVYCGAVGSVNLAARSSTQLVRVGTCAVAKRSCRTERIRSDAARAGEAALHRAIHAARAA